MHLGETMRADAAREPSKSDRLTVAVFRLGQWASDNKSRLLPKVVHRIVDMVWSRVVVGAELPASVVAGPGLRLRHWGRGIILHPKSVLGSDVTLFHRVTLGAKDDLAPTLGNGVYVGTGATILGGVKVGDGAIVAAGAVVVKDVPPGATAAGVPARII